MAKQSKLPGFTEIEDDAVEEAAEEYRDLTDKWLEKQKPALEAEKELQRLVAKNPAILEAARKHPKGKVRVGKCLLTFPQASDTPKIRVKLLKEADGE